MTAGVASAVLGGALESMHTALAGWFQSTVVGSMGATATSVAASATITAPMVIYGSTQSDYTGAISLGIGIGVAIAAAGRANVSGGHASRGTAPRNVDAELGLELMEGLQFDRKYGVDDSVFSGYDPGGTVLSRVNAGDLLGEAFRLGRDFTQLRSQSDAFRSMNI